MLVWRETVFSIEIGTNGFLAALPDRNHPAARGTSQECVCVSGGGHGFEGGCLLSEEGL